MSKLLHGIPIELRSGLRTKETLKACVEAGGPFSVERSFGDEWCGGCGRKVSDHRKED